MPVQTFFKVVSRLASLRWWEWVELAGCVAMIALTILLTAGYELHPALIAVLLHVACDFTCQSPETAIKKGERGRHLFCHALAAGGVPMAIAGIAAGSVGAILNWTVVGVASHYAVDWTRKFGIHRMLPGILLDQVCHLTLILVLTYGG